MPSNLVQVNHKDAQIHESLLKKRLWMGSWQSVTMLKPPCILVSLKACIGTTDEAFQRSATPQLLDLRLQLSTVHFNTPITIVNHAKYTIWSFLWAPPPPLEKNKELQTTTKHFTVYSNELPHLVYQPLEQTYTRSVCWRRFYPVQHHIYPKWNPPHSITTITRCNRNYRGP